MKVIVAISVWLVVLVSLVTLLVKDAKAQNTDRLVQWGFTKLMPPATNELLSNADRMLAWDHQNGELLPYAVPAGQCLGITGAHIGSKFGTSALAGYDRASYFIIDGVTAFKDSAGGITTFPQPLVMPSGAQLVMRIINNAIEPQWMTVLLFGVLRPCTTFYGPSAYQSVFHDWFTP